MKNKSILLLLLSIIFTFSITFAEVLNAKWYTKNLNVHLGDTFQVNLFVYPDPEHPVYTVSNSVTYSPNNLNFVDGVVEKDWLQVPNAPYYLTDTNLGLIRRTAGYTNGLVEPTKYATYTFKAKQVGKTTISIEDGFALDKDNLDVGFQSKEMTINVLPVEVPKEEVVASTTIATSTATTTEATVKKIDITMEAVGRTAIYEGEDYSAYVNLKGVSTSTEAGEVNVILYDLNNNIVYSKVEAFNTGETYKEIVVPKEALVEGDYLLNIKVAYKNSEVIETNKEIGVLKKEIINIPQYVIDNFYWIKYFVASLVLLITALLIHIHKDHELIEELEQQARRKNNRVG
jgi:hypothetical protein